MLFKAKAKKVKQKEPEGKVQANCTMKIIRADGTVLEEREVKPTIVNVRGRQHG